MLTFISINSSIYKRYNMIELNELKTDGNVRPDAPNYEWYLSAKKYFDFFVSVNPARKQELLKAITDYEKKYAIR